MCSITHDNLPEMCQGMFTPQDVEEIIHVSKRRQLEYAKEIRLLEQQRAILTKNIATLRAKINEELDEQSYWAEIVAQWRAKHRPTPTLRARPLYVRESVNQEPTPTLTTLPDDPPKQTYLKYKHGSHWSVQKGTPVPPRGYSQRRRSVKFLERVKLARE